MLLDGGKWCREQYIEERSEDCMLQEQNLFWCDFGAKTWEAEEEKYSGQATEIRAGVFEELIWVKGLSHAVVNSNSQAWLLNLGLFLCLLPSSLSPRLGWRGRGGGVILFMMGRYSSLIWAYTLHEIVRAVIPVLFYRWEMGSPWILNNLFKVIIPSKPMSLVSTTSDCFYPITFPSYILD